MTVRKFRSSWHLLKKKDLLRPLLKLKFPVKAIISMMFEKCYIHTPPHLSSIIMGVYTPR